MQFTNRAKTISPSATLAISARAKQLSSQGIDVASFGAGEPDFNTPDYIIDEAIVALRKGFTKYTPSRGMLPLREQICIKLERDNNLRYNANQIVVSNGAKQSIFNALQLLVDNGDEVIIPCPYWLTYSELVTMCNGVNVCVKTTIENNLKITPSQLEEAITERTKVFIFNSPNNPSGSVYSKSEVLALAKVLDKHPNISIISDEIYEKLIYDGSEHFSIACASDEMYERTIVVNGMSKTYAMTGWRIGYTACGNEKAAELMDNMQSHESSNANSIAQYASIEALKGGKSFLESMVNTFRTRRDVLNAGLRNINGIKVIEGQGAFYTLVDVSNLFGRRYKTLTINSSADIATILINDFATVVIPCETFGDERFIRLTYTVDVDTINKGVGRISQFISKIL